MASANTSKVKFTDLGRPTLRGVRKCPKCGTVNGTRGLSCKNQRCDVVFKNRNIKKNQLFDCVKVFMILLLLYSVINADHQSDH
jgi:Putative treble-clef, zinc-finger, Zn-binding